MKKTGWLLPCCLLLTLMSGVSGRPMTIIDAAGENWLAEAEETTPGEFGFSLEITPEMLLLQDENFPISAGTDPYYTQAEEITFQELSTVLETIGLFVPMIGDPLERAPYMTLGFADDNFGFVNGYHNMGRLTKVGFDIAEDQYTDPGTELEGAIGLQLREGQYADYSSADKAAGPTYVDNVDDWIVEWDLTWRTTDEPAHEGFTPFFEDESRLDDISNFRIIALEEVYFEKIYVEGYHFLEASNDTPYYYAMWEQNYVSESWGLDFNFDNRTDDGYEINGEDAWTSNLEPDEYYVTRELPFYADSEDGLVTLQVNVPVVVVDDETPLLELTFLDPMTPPNMPVSISGWVSTLEEATYGNQPIDAAYLDNPENVEISPIFGLQDANICFFSGEVMQEVYVTNQGASIEEPDPSAMGGNLVSLVTYSENVDLVDHFEGEDPNEYYTDYTFYEGGFLTLAEGYESQGTKVQEMHFTLDITATESYEGSASSNGFTMWLLDQNFDYIPETQRYIEIQPTDTTVYVDYLNVSAYKAISFAMEATDIKDTIFTFKLSMIGEEYAMSYYSNEDQALFYAQAFVNMTENVWGDDENGVCEGLSGSQWDDLADEYSYMTWTTQSLYVDNGLKMNAEAIDAMLDRYQYLNSLDPTTYPDFLNEEEPMKITPLPINTSDEGLFAMIAIFSTGAMAFIFIRRKKRIA